MPDLPEYDEFVECTNPDCVYRKAKPVTGLHGMAGGGMGPYTCCEICGTVLTKSQDAEILCDSHEDIGSKTDAQVASDKAEHAAESDSRPDLDE
jgi:hypothetical protein